FFFLSLSLVEKLGCKRPPPAILSQFRFCDFAKKKSQVNANLYRFGIFTNTMSLPPLKKTLC
ncbi:MAG: hypothetical protein IJX22_00940, partial [Opitutales bacterium]|nr:hypothetical protein [Opitutales bacterium]